MSSTLAPAALSAFSAAVDLFFVTLENDYRFSLAINLPFAKLKKSSMLIKFAVLIMFFRIDFHGQNVFSQMFLE